MAANPSSDANTELHEQKDANLYMQELAELRQTLKIKQERLNYLESLHYQREIQQPTTTDRYQYVNATDYRLKLRNALRSISPSVSSSSMSTMSSESRMSDSPPTESVYDSVNLQRQLAGKFTVDLPNDEENYDIPEVGPESFAIVPESENYDEFIDNLDSYTLMLSCDVRSNAPKNQANTPANDALMKLLNNDLLKIDDHSSHETEVKELPNQWPVMRRESTQLYNDALVKDQKQQTVGSDLVNLNDTPNQFVLKPTNLSKESGATDKSGFGQASNPLSGEAENSENEVRREVRVNLREMVRQMSEDESYPVTTRHVISDAVSIDLEPDSAEWWKVFAKLLDVQNQMLKKKLKSYENLKFAPNLKNEGIETLAPTESPHTQNQVESDKSAKVIEHLHQQLQKLRMKYHELEDVNQEWLKYRQRKDEQLAVCRSKLSNTEAKLSHAETKLSSTEVKLAKVEAHKMGRNAEMEVRMQYQGEMDYMTQELEESRRQCRVLAGQVRQMTSQLEVCHDEHTSHPLNNTAEAPYIFPDHTEHNAIKIQLQAFQEDFEREHAELVQLQTARDGLQRQLSSLNQRLKSAESSKLKATDESGRYRQQLSEAKKITRKTEDLLQAKTRECDTIRTELNMLKQQRVWNSPAATAKYPLQIVSPPIQPVPSPKPQPLYPQQQPIYDEQTRLTSENDDIEISGSWRCMSCTFSNAPIRTVCEVCGRVNEFTSPSKRTTNSINEVGERLLSRSINRPTKTTTPKVNSDHAPMGDPNPFHLMGDSEHLNTDGGWRRVWQK